MAMLQSTDGDGGIIVPKSFRPVALTTENRRSQDYDFHFASISKTAKWKSISINSLDLKT